MEKPTLEEVFLKHYGVKGMKWGQRKATIKKARRDMGAHERKLASAEQTYLKARDSGNQKRADKALADLNDTFKKREANRLTANTLTRGEQITVGVLNSLVFTPVGGAAVVGAAAAVVSDKRKLKDYPVKTLTNVKADD